MTLNELYSAWVQAPNADRYDKLLQSVRAQIIRQASKRNPADAEDIAQDVTITVHTRLKAHYDLAKGSLSSWVYRITDDHMKDRYRKQQRRCQLLLPASSKIPEARSADYILPNDFIVHLILEGHSMADCVRITGMSRKAIRFHLKRLRSVVSSQPL